MEEWKKWVLIIIVIVLIYFILKNTQEHYIITTKPDLQNIESRAVHGPGQPCDNGQLCMSRMCVDGKCAGDICDPNITETSPYYAVYVPPKVKLGDYCNCDKNCETNKCHNNKCVKSINERCKIDSECETEKCSNGKCVCNPSIKLQHYSRCACNDMCQTGNCQNGKCLEIDRDYCLPGKKCY